MTIRNKQRTTALLLSLLMALVAVAPVGRVSAAANPNPGVIPPYGNTYGVLSNKWWQWALSIPVVQGQEQDNPLFDTTGASCGVSQSGHVFYLAGIFSVLPGNGPLNDAVVRTQCVVPAGDALFFPILNAEDDIITHCCDAPTVENMRAWLRGSMNDANSMTASIDGVSVSDIEQYRAGSDNATFNFTLPEHNLFNYYGYNAPGGKYRPAVSDGYYLLLEPLAPGSHEIHFAGSFGNYFSLDITYELTVR